jgi:hypothetical protein
MTYEQWLPTYLAKTGHDPVADILKIKNAWKQKQFRDRRDQKLKQLESGYVTTKSAPAPTTAILPESAYNDMKYRLTQLAEQRYGLDPEKYLAMLNDPASVYALLESGITRKMEDEYISQDTEQESGYVTDDTEDDEDDFIYTESPTVTKAKEYKTFTGFYSTVKREISRADALDDYTHAHGIDVAMGSVKDFPGFVKAVGTKLTKADMAEYYDNNREEHDLPKRNTVNRKEPTQKQFEKFLKGEGTLYL